MKICVFASGRGSNFRAIMKEKRDDYNERMEYLGEANISLLFSDNKDAPVLEVAKEYGMETLCVSPKNFENKEMYERFILKELQERKIEAICLAGYMRMIGNILLNAYPNKILNIHPSLLPAFPGLNAQKQALEYGVKVTGCTVHFVDSGMDTGPILMQSVVEIGDYDNVETLSNRILKEEHNIYSQVLHKFTKGTWIFKGKKSIYAPHEY